MPVTIPSPTTITTAAFRTTTSNAALQSIPEITTTLPPLEQLPKQVTHLNSHWKFLALRLSRSHVLWSSYHLNYSLSPTKQCLESWSCNVEHCTIILFAFVSVYHPAFVIALNSNPIIFILTWCAPLLSVSPSSFRGDWHREPPHQRRGQDRKQWCHVCQIQWARESTTTQNEKEEKVNSFFSEKVVCYVHRFCG